MFKVVWLVKVLGFLFSALSLILYCLDTNSRKTVQNVMKFYINYKSQYLRAVSSGIFRSQTFWRKQACVGLNRRRISRGRKRKKQHYKQKRLGGQKQYNLRALTVLSNRTLISVMEYIDLKDKLKPGFVGPKLEFECYLLLRIFQEKRYPTRVVLYENNLVALGGFTGWKVMFSPLPLYEKGLYFTH